MRDLRKDSDTVSRLSFRILSCPMLQTFHDLQRIIHQSVALFTLHMDDRSDTAVLMLKGRIVKAVLSKLILRGFL